MSDKSSIQDPNHDKYSSHSSYSRQQNHQIQQKPMSMGTTIPQQLEPQRRRQEVDEIWNLPFQSPGFPFQLPPQSFAQIQNLNNFSLSKPENLFEDYAEVNMNQDRRNNNPLRKVSGPFDMMLGQDLNATEEDVLLNLTGQQQQNLMKSVGDRQYMQPVQNRFPFPMQVPLMKSAAPPAPPYQNVVPPQMMSMFQPQQFKQYQQYPQNMPYFSYMPYGIMPLQREPEAHQYVNNISTVSKELQTKVYMISQQTTVSQFQCNCKKSKCLKLYCECFANGQVCSQSCNCMDCKNRIDNMQERQKAIEEALIRNNDAFNNILNGKQPLFPPGTQPQAQNPVQIDQFPSQRQFNISQVKDEKGLKGASQTNRARKGCNCKKSNCKKKYCECYSAGLACTDQCKCESCQNCKNGISGPDSDEKPIGQHINNNIIINQQQNIITIGQSGIKVEEMKKTKVEDTEDPQTSDSSEYEDDVREAARKAIRKSKKIKKVTEENMKIRIVKVPSQTS